MHVIPSEVRKGMKVFDRLQKEIGKVEDFRFSENDTDHAIQPEEIDPIDRTRQDTFMLALTQSFVADGLPQELHDRLLTEGYVKLDAKGLFAADKYILPEQIASADGQGLFLNVDMAALIG